MDKKIIEYVKLDFERLGIKEQIVILNKRLKEIDETQKFLQKNIREECGKTGKSIDKL